MSTALVIEASRLLGLRKALLAYKENLCCTGPTSVPVTKGSLLMASVKGYTVAQKVGMHYMRHIGAPR